MFKYWIGLLSIICLMFAAVVTLTLILIFETPFWIAAGVSLIILAVLLFIGFRERTAAPLKMKESSWNDEE